MFPIWTKPEYLIQNMCYILYELLISQNTYDTSTLKYLTDVNKISVGITLAIRGIHYGLVTSDGPTNLLNEFWVW
jgi:hypothetical protein